MNQRVIDKVDIFNNGPKHIDGVINFNDRSRMYDIAITLYETQGSLEELKQYLQENLSQDFLYRKKVLDDCIQSISIIYSFLDYYKNL